MRPFRLPSPRVVVAVAALLALPACQQRIGDLAPFTQVGSAPDSVGGTVIVQKGDSAYILSRRYNVPLRDLIEVNRLTPPYVLEVGQRLTLPVSRQYVVQRGDTLYGISRMFNVDVSELTRINNLPPPYAVHTGQPLRLPGGDGRPAGTAVADASSSASSAAAAGVAVGNSVGGKSAGRGSIQVTELPAPGASSPSAASTSTASTSTAVPAPSNPPAPAGNSAGPLPPVKPGGTPAPAPAGEADVAYLPGQAPTVLRPPGQKPSVTAEPATPPVAAAAPASAQAAAAPLPPTPPAGRSANPAQPAAPQQPAQAEQVAAAAPPPPKDAAKDTDDEPPARGGGRFLWPVKGKLLSSYGPKPDGMHNDGLNIAAAKGAAVVAADNGIVAYSGNELRGFGNLLLIRHADGWITAYAHLDTIEVERGAKVKRGQTIGRVGQTGSVTSPQLHFELRKGSQAVDPRDQLDKRSS